MLMLTLAVLAAAAVAVAGDHEREMKVFAFADDEDGNFRVEVVQEDGVAKVKVWKVVDGEETLVKEYETSDAPGDVEVDGKRIIILGDDMRCGGVAQDGDGGHRYFMKRFGDGGDDDFAWNVNQGGTWLGVQLADLDEAKAAYFEVKDGDGALVTEVVADSPAAAAGIQIYDVIVKLDDEAIGDADDAVEYVRSRDADDQVKVTVVRKGKRTSFTAELGERPAQEFAFAPRGPQGNYHMFNPERLERLHEGLAPRHEGDAKEIQNLRADIEELRAMIEELKNNR
jgi:membrane-associated protease RseP (regulator of RpoE activity)